MFVVIAGLACITETLPEIYDSVMTSMALPDYPPRTMKEGPWIMRRHINITHAPEQLLFWQPAGNSVHTADHLGA
jgi:hypothetical protein